MTAARKREPLRLPKVGEIWHTQRGRLVRMVDIGQAHERQRERKVIVQKLAGGLDGARQTMGLVSLLVYYHPPGVAWEPRPRQRRPRVGEVWRTAAGSECVILEAGKTTEPISARRVSIRIVVARGAFVVGDVTTALVGDFIRRWALVEQKAVA